MAIDYLRNLRLSLSHREEMKNKYFYRSRISEAKIVRHFAMDINASKTALLCGGNTINTIYSKIKIVEYTLTNITDYGEFDES